MLLGSLLGVAVGVLFARIVAEFILIVFRINEHLGAIRNQGEDAIRGGSFESPPFRTDRLGLRRGRNRSAAASRLGYVAKRKCITSPSATT